MKTIKKWNSGKFKKELCYYGYDMPFTALWEGTGVYGMYCEQIRHRWIGIKGLFGFRYTVTWGYNY